ncbi:MAG: nuclear transport factor 2 family protein [Steroidobacteraceae bacterium]
MSSGPAVEALVTGRAEQRILALMTEYCDSIDRGDLDACAALFRGGRWGIAGHLAEGETAVRALLANVTLYDGLPLTRHLMSNVLIQVAADGGHATARSCIMVMQGVAPDFPLQPIFIGSYHDIFVRETEQWCFRERVIVPDLVGDLSRHRSDLV